MKVKFVGFSRFFEYPCYEDENGTIYFDINFGRGRISLYTGAFKDEFGDINGEPNREVRKTIEIVDEIPKTREKRFCELDTEIENWTVDEQNFVLWSLLRAYADRLEIPEQCNTVEDYRKEKVNHGLWVDCNELIDMLNFELWR